MLDMYKIIAIAAVCFALLAFGFSRWKKKYGHTNRPFKAGDKRPQTANFDIGRAIAWEGGRGCEIISPESGTAWSITFKHKEGETLGVSFIPPAT